MNLKRLVLLIAVFLMSICFMCCSSEKEVEVIPEENNYTLSPGSMWFDGQPIDETIIDRSEINTISFVKEKPEGTPVKEWNADVAQSGDIKVYVFGTPGSYDLYIVGNKIKGNADSQTMFVSFEKLVSIFFGHFDTTSIKDMSFGFYGCSSLQVLDLSSFNPSNITQCDKIFESFGRLGSVIKINSKYAAFFDQTDLGDKIFWSYSSGIYTCIQSKTCVVSLFDGSTSPCEISVDYGDYFNPNWYIPEKDGYGFLGWYYDGECTQYFSGSEAIKSDTKLYARWAPGVDVACVEAKVNVKELSLHNDDKITATFCSGGYSTTISQQISNDRVKFVFLESFVVASTGTISVTVENSEDETIGSAEKNVTFEDDMSYEITVLETGVEYFTVSFDTNGGLDIASQLIRSGNQVSIPAANPTKKDYLFDGWYTDPDCNGASYNFNTPVDSDFTLYAKWIDSLTTEKWCVITYMDFSNLTSYGLKNLDEICQTTSNQNVKAYFITGGASSSYSVNNYPYLASAIQAYNSVYPFAPSASADTYQLWEYTSNGSFVEITPPKSKGMNDSNVLAYYIDYCYNLAEESDTDANFKYILDLWDHGGGSYVGLIRDDAITAQRDEDNMMSLASCGNAIKSATNKNGFKFEVVIFDMCLMQSIEIAHVVSYDCAKYIIGSQTSSAASGSAYTDWFNFLYNHPEATGYEFGIAFCNSSYEKIKNEQISSFTKNITWSVLDMSKFAAVESAYEAYVASDLSSLSASSVENVLSTIDSLPAFSQSGYICFWEYFMYDINVFTQTVGTSVASSALMRAIDEAVVYKKYGSTQESAGCCGLSMCVLTNKNGWEKRNYSSKWNSDYLNKCLSSNFRNFQIRIASNLE